MKITVSIIFAGCIVTALLCGAVRWGGGKRVEGNGVVIAKPPCATPAIVDPFAKDEAIQLAQFNEAMGIQPDCVGVGK